MKTLLSSRDRSDAIAMGYDGPTDVGDENEFMLYAATPISNLPPIITFSSKEDGTWATLDLTGISQIRCVRDALNKVLKELEHANADG